MKLIYEFCLEVLKKIKEHVATTIAVAVVGLILAIFVLLKDNLITVYTLGLPLWAWLLFGVIAFCLPVIILKIIDLRRKQNVLTDEDDIFNKLHWWVGQQRDFVRQETENNKLVTWHFSVIDRSLRLNPGSAKKFLPAMFSAESKYFPITILNKGRETIALRYDLKPSDSTDNSPGENNRANDSEGSG